VPEEHFPPCIKNHIFKGVTDGRKRSVFILVNFLRNMGWNVDQIEKRLVEWNEKNYPPLRTNYLRSQLRWHFRQDRNLLPPNCDNQNFYISMGVCDPDEICKGGTDKITIKNPANYPFRKMRKPLKKEKSGKRSTSNPQNQL
jgi:DNA primase large subunit